MKTSNNINTSNKMNTGNKMKTGRLVLITALIAALAAGATGAYAFYTAKTSTVTNSYNIVAGGGASGESVGSVEESFDPETAKDLGPRATFTKDVKVSSKLDYASYVYLYVTIPAINARLQDESAKSVRESVSLDFDNTGWTLVKHTDGTLDKAAAYLYRYGTVLDARATTPSLFTKVTVPDYAEADSVSGSIDVTGYMISSEGVSSADADSDAISKFFS